MVLDVRQLNNTLTRQYIALFVQEGLHRTRTFGCIHPHL